MCLLPLFLSVHTNTIATRDFLRIHNNVMSRHPGLNLGICATRTKQHKKSFEQFLKLNSAQEVGLHLLPGPALFLSRDWWWKIVRPDNGAAVGIVALFRASPPVFS